MESADRRETSPTMWLDCSNGITSMKFLDAIARGTDDHRSWAHVRHFMHSEQARQHASAVFEVLAHAEAQAHGVSVDEVHFHEVGRLENLSFVLGIFAALDMLGIEEWYASPPVLGNGKVTCSHGELAVPAPATQRIVDTHGIPIALIDDEPIIGELTTPTGAALLTQAKGFLITAPKDALILRT